MEFKEAENEKSNKSRSQNESREEYELLSFSLDPKILSFFWSIYNQDEIISKDILPKNLLPLEIVVFPPKAEVNFTSMLNTSLLSGGAIVLSMGLSSYCAYKIIKSFNHKNKESLNPQPNNIINNKNISDTNNTDYENGFLCRFYNTLRSRQNNINQFGNLIWNVVRRKRESFHVVKIHQQPTATLNIKNNIYFDDESHQNNSQKYSNKSSLERPNELNIESLELTESGADKRKNKFTSFLSSSCKRLPVRMRKENKEINKTQIIGMEEDEEIGLGDIQLKYFGPSSNDQFTKKGFAAVDEDEEEAEDRN